MDNTVKQQIISSLHNEFSLVRVKHSSESGLTLNSQGHSVKITSSHLHWPGLQNSEIVLLALMDSYGFGNQLLALMDSYGFGNQLICRTKDVAEILKPAFSNTVDVLVNTQDIEGKLSKAKKPSAPSTEDRILNLERQVKSLRKLVQAVEPEATQAPVVAQTPIASGVSSSNRNRVSPRALATEGVILLEYLLQDGVRGRGRLSQDISRALGFSRDRVNDLGISLEALGLLSREKGRGNTGTLLKVHNGKVERATSWIAARIQDQDRLTHTNSGTQV